MTTLPEGWTVEDIQYLLEKLDAGHRILVADHELGLPTIHDEGLGSAVHLGFGVFKVETSDYTVLFDAGGAMQHTPSGQSWSPLSTREGEYAYDVEAARATLQGYMNNGAGAKAEAEAESGPAGYVPDHVLAGYPDLVRTHYKHPHNVSETLCGRSVGDDTRVSRGDDDSDDEVDCDECLCYARRGHDMYGKALSPEQKDDDRPTDPDQAEPQSQEPWQMTRQEFQRANTANLTRSRDAQIVNHRQAVEQALADGKPVPTPVLADYPDLVAGETAEAESEKAHTYAKYRVEAASVEDFLDRYYKPERFRGRGEEYAASLIASYTADVERDGYTIISRHDSVTGKVVAFFGPVEKGQAPRQPKTAEPTESETLSRDEAQADADAVSPVCDNALRNAFAAHRGGINGGIGHPPMCDSNKAVRVVTVYKDGDGEGETLNLCDECYQWSRKNARACGYRFKSKKLVVARARQATRQPEPATPDPSNPAPGPPAVAPDNWTPAPGDQAEFERWELHLLTGETGKRSSAFYRALKQVARPGTLRLALLQVNGSNDSNEGRRWELLEKRLAALAGPEKDEQGE